MLLSGMPEFQLILQQLAGIISKITINRAQNGPILGGPLILYFMILYNHNACTKLALTNGIVLILG